MSSRRAWRSWKRARPAVSDQILARIERLEEMVKQLQFDISHADRRSNGNSERVTQAHNRVGDVSDRVHKLEDLFEPGGSFALLEAAVWQLATDVETLKQARAAGDASD